MIQHISLVVFDLDGTLVDSKYDLADALNHTARVLGYPETTDDEIPQRVGDGVQMLINRTFGFKPGSPETGKARKLFMDYYGEHLTKRTSFYPGIRELIDAMPPHIKMAVLSNKPHDFTVSIIQQLGLSGRFGQVRGFSDEFPRKPAPEALLYIMHQMGVRSEQCLMVGDGDADIGVGQAAGCQTCAVTYGYRTREQLEKLQPNYIIDHANELAGLLGI